MPPLLRSPSLYPPPFQPSHKPRYHVLFALFVTFLFVSMLTACPEPPIQSDGSSENPEGGVEKTEPTAEMNPEEFSNPEESVSPEDGAPIEQEPIREDGPELEIKETDKPYIERVNGNGSQLPVNAAASPSKIDNLPAAPTKPSPSRIKDALVIEGNLLNQIDRWVLQSKDARNSEQTWANQQIQKDSDMKHTLSLLGRNLVAGAFLLLGYTANTQVVSADVFILQGEPGVKGDIGDNKFTDSDATLLKALLTKLQANGDNLDITANTITFKSATAQKFTLDLGNNATIKSGNATLDFAGDTITAKATTFSTTANRFEAKGSNGTALVLDDTAKTITFEKANVRILNGTTKTDQANGLGNLILGYNDATLPANPPFTLQRTGSHNLVIGDVHSYPTTAGIVAGRYNNLVGKSASILGGTQNQAYSEGSVILGGVKNRTGKINNTTAPFYGLHATILGGSSNQAYGETSAILGGNGNVTGKEDDASEGSHASVSGGQSNNASGSHASVSGGQSNNARFSTSFICGGVGPQSTTGSGQVICP